MTGAWQCSKGFVFAKIYIYKALRSLVRRPLLFVPRGTNNLIVPQGTNISHTLLVGGGQTICLSLGDKHFSHTGGGEGQTICLYPGGQTICLSPGDKHFSHTAWGGDKHFSIIMMMIKNVSEANILSTKARKPPAEFPGP